MGLMYYPKQGEILLCDYSTGFIPPEMVKVRPVIVISPRLRRRANLVSVVPLSTTEPDTIEAHHCLIELEHLLPRPFNSQIMWAKCDMVATISLNRLDRFRVKRSGGAARRLFVSGQVGAEQLLSIRAAVLCGLGFDSLTIHL